MTIGEAAERILGTHAVWDSALPVTWCERMKRITGEWPHAFVWVYDGGLQSLSGRPCALTPAANAQLEQYNAWAQCEYPLTPNPVTEEAAK